MTTWVSCEWKMSNEKMKWQIYGISKHRNIQISQHKQIKKKTKKQNKNPACQRDIAFNAERRHAHLKRETANGDS